MQDKFGKIQNLQIRGYEREIDGLSLDDIHNVIGQNGAGKSDFVVIFRFLARLVRENLQEFVVIQGGLQRLLHLGPQATQEMAVGGSLGSKHIQRDVCPDGRWPAGIHR